MIFPHYKDIHDWIVMEERTIHAYNEEESPIQVVKLNIGTLDVSDINSQNHYSTRTFPIIRWISKSEYDYLCKHEGTAIW